MNKRVGGCNSDIKGWAGRPKSRPDVSSILAILHRMPFVVTPINLNMITMLIVISDSIYLLIKKKIRIWFPFNVTEIIFELLGVTTILKKSPRPTLLVRLLTISLTFQMSGHPILTETPKNTEYVNVL